MFAVLTFSSYNFRTNFVNMSHLSPNEPGSMGPDAGSYLQQLENVAKGSNPVNSPELTHQNWDGQIPWATANPGPSLTASQQGNEIQTKTSSAQSKERLELLKARKWQEEGQIHPPQVWPLIHFILVKLSTQISNFFNAR